MNRKAEIYRIALDLFIEKGYDATSLSMIAKRLSISKARLYYYCPSKEGLLYQIHMKDLQEHVIPILEGAEKISDPQERLVNFLRNFTLLCTSSRAARVLVHEIHSLNKIHQNKILAIWRRAYNLMRVAVEELQKSGRGRKFRTSFVPYLGVGMAFWTIYWWDYSRQVNSEELAETLVQVFKNGLFYSGKN